MVGVVEADTETGLYYLRSRYYNPEWGRFINADEQVGMITMFAQNFFAYCRNSVVMRRDEDGTWDEWLVIDLHESVTPAIQMFLESPSDYGYKRDDGGYIRRRGDTPGAICCAYLMYVIDGGGAKGSNTRYKNAKRAGLTGDIQEIIDAVNAGASLEDFAGLDVYQVDKNGVAGHVGRLVIHDFGDGMELAVFQSVAGSINKTKALFPDDENEGPNITALIQKDGTTGAWTHYGEVQYKKRTSKQSLVSRGKRGNGKKPVVKGRANTNWLWG